MSQLEHVQDKVERHLNEISGMFKRGVRLTFIARTPGNDEADLFMTLDDLDELAKVIERTKARKSKEKL